MKNCQTAPEPQRLRSSQSIMGRTNRTKPKTTSIVKVAFRIYNVHSVLFRSFQVLPTEVSTSWIEAKFNLHHLAQSNFLGTQRYLFPVGGLWLIGHYKDWTKLGQKLSDPHSLKFCYEFLKKKKLLILD